MHYYIYISPPAISSHTHTAFKSFSLHSISFPVSFSLSIIFSLPFLPWHKVLSINLNFPADFLIASLHLGSCVQTVACADCRMMEHIVNEADTGALFSLDLSQWYCIKNNLSPFLSVDAELSRSQVPQSSHQIQVEQAVGTGCGCHPSTGWH